MSLTTSVDVFRAKIARVGSSVRLLASAVVAVASAACGDALPTRVEVLEPSVAQTSVTGSRVVLDERLEKAAELAPVPDVLSLLQPGQCMLEFGVPTGGFHRVRRTLLQYADNGPTTPFAVSYRPAQGRRQFRGTCNVARDAWEIALDQISWKPGDGMQAGKGWGVELTIPPGLLEEGPLPTTETGGGDTPWNGPSFGLVNWEDYYHYDYCFYLADGFGNAIAVLYCGYYSGPEQEGCDTDPFLAANVLAITEECTSPGGGPGNTAGDHDEVEVCDEVQEWCEWRNRHELSEWESEGIDSTIVRLKRSTVDHGVSGFPSCSEIGTAIEAYWDRLGDPSGIVVYDGQPSLYPSTSYGRYDWDYDVITLWSGAPEYRKAHWGETLVHEFLHTAIPRDYTSSQHDTIRGIGETCGAGLPQPVPTGG